MVWLSVAELAARMSCAGALKLVFLAATFPDLEFREEVPALVCVDASEIKAARRGAWLLQLQLNSDGSTYLPISWE